MEIKFVFEKTNWLAEMKVTDLKQQANEFNLINHWQTIEQTTLAVAIDFTSENIVQFHSQQLSCKIV